MLNKEVLKFGLSRFWPPINEAGVAEFYCWENRPVFLSSPGSEVLGFFCTALHQDFLQRKHTEEGGILQPESGLAPGALPAGPGPGSEAVDPVGLVPGRWHEDAGVSVFSPQMWLLRLRSGQNGEFVRWVCQAVAC